QRWGPRRVERPVDDPANPPVSPPLGGGGGVAGSPARRSHVPLPPRPESLSASAWPHHGRVPRSVAAREEQRVSRKVFVVGVGMTKFEKPGSRDWDYPDMAMESGTKALSDAGIPYEEIDQACVG